MSVKKPPFSLEQLAKATETEETHFIEIAQDQLQAMYPSRAAEKLYHAMEQELNVPEKEAKWGVNLPKKNALLAGEQFRTSDAAQARRDAIALYSRTIRDIAQELDIEPKDVEALIQDSDGNETPEELKPYEDRILSCFLALSDSSMTPKLITAVIKQRLISTWTEKDTNCLHSNFYQAFEAYIRGEQSGWKQATEGEDEAEEAEGKEQKKEPEVLPS